MKTAVSSTILVTLFTGIPVLHGAILINSIGSFGYSQNFDTPSYATEVATAGTGAPIAWSWTNDSTYAGWTRQVAIGITSNRLDKDYIGEFTSGTIRFGNMGSSTTIPADRALGVMMQGPTTNSASFGMVFQVGAGLGVTGANFSYTGEQWFSALNGTTNSPDRMEFQYQILNSYNAATFLINDLTGWTDVNALDFSAQQEVELTPVKIDGNAAANRAARSSVINLSATEGQFIAFRWNYVSQENAVQSALAVDDLNISFSTVAIPEPSSAMLALLGASFLLRRSRS